MTVGAPVIVNTREESLPLITLTPEPKPEIVRFFENSRGPDVSVI